MNTDVVKNNLIDKIVEKINKIPKHHELRLNPELILLVCNIVENTINKSDKVSKKDVVIDVFKQINHITCENDINLLGSLIEFLHSNDKIKKVKLLSKLHFTQLVGLKRSFFNLAVQQIIHYTINYFLEKYLLKMGVSKFVIILILLI